MSLSNLNELFVAAKELCSKVQERSSFSLPSAFKENYKALVENKRAFSRHDNARWLSGDNLALHSRNNGTMTFIPSIFFHIAKELVPLYRQLCLYRDTLISVLNEAGKSLDEIEESDCVPYIQTSSLITGQERIFLCKFVTDGSWWGKGRQIKRAQDFYESPLMQSAGLTQETQSEVARITKQLSDEPSLLYTLQDGAIWLESQFKKWYLACKCTGTNKTETNSTIRHYATGLNAISMPEGEKDTQKWEGAFVYLMGHLPELPVFAIEDRSEFERIYGEFCSILDKEPILNTDVSRYDECWKYFKGQRNQGYLTDHGNFSAAVSAYREFLLWYKENKVPTLNDLHASGTQFWTYSPGRNGDKWDEVRTAGEITLRLQGCPDFNSFVDEKAIRAWFQDKEGDEASHKNNVCAALDFRDRMKVGDYVFAKKGLKTYLGVGKVVGDYLYDESRNEYCHIRKVEWLKIKTVDLDDARPAPKVLTDVTPWPDFVERIWKAYFEEATEPILPPNVDKLGIALKLFEKCRDQEEVELTPELAKEMFFEYLKKNTKASDETARNYITGLDRGLQIKSGLETVVAEGIVSRSLFEIVDSDEFAAEVERIKSCKSFAEFEERYHVQTIYSHYLAFLRSIEKRSSANNLEGEFRYWCREINGKSKNTPNSYLSPLKSVAKPQEMTGRASTWRGVYDFVYGHCPEKSPLEIESVSELEAIYGDLLKAFEVKDFPMPNGVIPQNWNKVRAWYKADQAKGSKKQIIHKWAFEKYSEFLAWRQANGPVVELPLPDEWDSYNDKDKKIIRSFIEEQRNNPKAISYYLEAENLPKVEGFNASMALRFMMELRPLEYAAFSSTIDEMLLNTGVLKAMPSPKLTIANYEAIKSAQGVVLARMHELKIGKLANDNSAADYLTVNEFAWWMAKQDNKDLIKEKVMASIYKPVEIKKVNQTKIDNFADFIEKLEKDVKAAGLKYAENLLRRFVCAQLAKPFVVLTGLSGSGKTKLAEAFSKWIGVENTWRIVPVGADWTNSEKLLGCPNALDDENYVLPDTGVLNLMLDAADHPELPFFLILDEMNLSHVERYFADFLSAMESGDEIKLYDGNKRYANGREIPQSFKFPKNLFVIGTMNVDETTYMFSPKVLDRAQVIEFRVKANDMEAFLTSTPTLDLKSISEKGAMYAEAFLALAKLRGAKKPSDIQKLNDVTAALADFFKPLSELGSEFGYRSAAEILSFVGYYLDSGSDIKAKESIDAAIMQKLLPKLHGSRRQLEKPLETLWKLSLANGGAASIETLAKVEGQVNDFDYKSNCRFPISAEKIARLYKNSKDNGFASFAEA